MRCLRRNSLILEAIIGFAVMGFVVSLPNSGQATGGTVYECGPAPCIVPSFKDVEDMLNPGGKGIPFVHHYFVKSSRIQIRFTLLESYVLRWTEQATNATVCESHARWHTITNGVVALRYLRGDRYLYFYAQDHGRESQLVRVHKGGAEGRWELASGKTWAKIKVSAGQWSYGEHQTEC